MLVVTLYLKSENEDYQQIRRWLDALRNEIPHQVVDINISFDDKLQKRFGDQIPAAQIGPYLLRWPFTEPELRVSLHAAQDRNAQYENAQDEKFRGRVKRGKTLSGADRFSLWFARNYMLVITLLLLIYTGLPILAPVLMHNQMPGAARVIYTIYKPLCHQLGFRSIFLFGEQLVYPRELAHLEGYQTYEELTGQTDVDVLEARRFVGNEQAGYKIALCQRDMAMYGSLLLFSIIFLISGRKIKGIRWYVWLVLGVFPIGLDGFSQLPGVVSSSLPAWIPVRESVPFLRYLTGFLFGFFTGWYLFPILEETMSDVYQLMKRKTLVIQQLEESDTPERHASSKQ